MLRRQNRLSREKSPYLLQHSTNPVDWYPWGEEALARARTENKPILLSIGYSTCHWCHVMERESFEDEEIARMMNENFVSVKVDREERPDIDQLYMTAVQAMTGQGGWPLTVFLTPDLKPFYGGTYFPPEPRYGMPSFKQVLQFVSSLWKEKKDEVSRNAADVTEALKRSFEGTQPGNLGRSVLDEGYASVLSSFDEEYGGFGAAPKFPLPTYIMFLLRYHYRTGKEMALKAAVRSLESMSRGGIRDHVGGGFHRYSTDRAWRIPHFEKMLYDNSLLALAYLQAFQLTGNENLRTTARETLRWLEREMVVENGAFGSGQDADTEEGEGSYYTWTPSEVRAILGERDGEVFCRIYGVTDEGNFEGRTVLREAQTPEETAMKFGMSRGEVESRLPEWKEKLYQRRLERKRPQTDDKILASWNGLAISAFAYGSRVLSDAYRKRAEAAASFVSRKLIKDGKLLHRYRDGDAAIEGTLDDYAFLSQGFLDLFEASGDPEWFSRAVELTDRMISLFEDSETGLLYSSVADDIPVRIKDTYDGPVPSGNSVAAVNMLRISELTGERSYASRAEKILKAMAASLEGEPRGHTYGLCAADLLINGMGEVVIASAKPEGATDMLRVVNRHFIPDSVLVVVTEETYPRLQSMARLLEGRRPRDTPTAYVCRNYVCKLPALSADQLEAQLTARD